VLRLEREVIGSNPTMQRPFFMQYSLGSISSNQKIVERKLGITACAIILQLGGWSLKTVGL